VMQFGVASARFDDKVRLMSFEPDMMSVCFNAHDEYFQPDPAFPPNKMFAIHPQEELIDYARAGDEHQVKLEIECFHPGAFWNIAFLRREGLLALKPYVTLFLGWPGGCWTPPTERALLYMVDHLPEDVTWSVSVMNPEKQWDLLALAISLGGNIRVGYEDNPFIRAGELAANNAQLVERAVDLVHSLGRDVATPEEARKIIGLSRS
jgi:3-keto-5-aminohexanoate cleavage enzyme